MATRIERRPQQRGNTVNRSVVLRKVMEVLSVKGFAKASIADLASAAGVGYSTLRKTFGTKDEILRAAIRFCVSTEACLAHEPLRVSPTGREAILSMLEENTVTSALAPILWLPLYVQRLYHSSRRRRPAGVFDGEASFTFRTYTFTTYAIHDRRRTSRRHPLRGAREPLPHPPKRPYVSRPEWRASRASVPIY